MDKGRVIRREGFQDETVNGILKHLTTGSVIIEAQEMKSLVEDWTLNGYGDLIVDESFLERLTTYTNFKKNLTQALYSLLEQEFERYMLEDDCYYLEYCGEFDVITSDNKFLFTCNMYAYESANEEYAPEPKYVKVMSIPDFKFLLAALGNKNISYLQERFGFHVDVALYLRERGIELKFKTSKSDRKSVQLIITEDKEKKDGKSSRSDVQ